MHFKGRTSEAKPFSLNGQRSQEGSNQETVTEIIKAGDTVDQLVETEGNIEVEGLLLMVVIVEVLAEKEGKGEEIVGEEMIVMIETGEEVEGGVGPILGKIKEGEGVAAIQANHTAKRSNTY